MPSDRTPVRHHYDMPIPLIHPPARQGAAAGLNTAAAYRAGTTTSGPGTTARAASGVMPRPSSSVFLVVSLIVPSGKLIVVGCRQCLSEQDCSGKKGFVA